MIDCPTEGHLFAQHRTPVDGTGRQVRFLEFADESDVDPAVVPEFLDLALVVRATRRSG